MFVFFEFFAPFFEKLVDKPPQSPRAYTGARLKKC